MAQLDCDLRIHDRCSHVNLAQVTVTGSAPSFFFVVVSRIYLYTSVGNGRQLVYDLGRTVVLIITELLAGVLTLTNKKLIVWLACVFYDII